MAEPTIRRTDPRRALPPARSPYADHSLRILVTEAAHKAKLLARKEIELAQVEAKADLRSEVKMATGLGVGGVSALLTVAMMLVAAIFGLVAAGVAGWLASLIVAAAVLLVGTVAALYGWRQRVTRPLETTRRTLQEDLQWAKDVT